MGKYAFVTVGTTKFDDLIRAIDDPEVLLCLANRGFTSVVAQIGHGDYKPVFNTHTKLCCEYFRFKPTLLEDMERADLVVSHAGAGSIMEALGKGKALVAVVNDRLMNNHQEELANAMAERNYLLATSPEGLATTLSYLDESRLQPYPTPRPEAFAAVIDDEMHSQCNT
ncbi:unnamed protein product [Choristocarpus tenellus]